MKLDSKYFDKIRVKSSAEKKAAPEVTMCEWPGCAKPARHKAPKGRGAEGQFHNYCTEHVQQYNKTYNYFSGMKDDEVQVFQKDAQTGHRPTWKLGQNGTANVSGVRRRNKPVRDHFDLFGAGKDGAAPKERVLRHGELKSLHTLGLDENATPAMAKAQYKTLVKRLHPDANNGSRANEETLKAVIQAYDKLRSTGFC
jgi:DnaJ domain